MAGPLTKLNSTILPDTNAAHGGANALEEQFPRLAGFLKGLQGTAPDEVGGSVLDGSHADMASGANWGFPIGTAAQALPLIGPALKWASTGSKAQQIAQGLEGLGSSYIIDHPFLKPSVALGSDPYAGLSGPDASNMTRYLAKLRNPAFQNREIMRETGASAYATQPLGVHAAITPEDLFREGSPLIALPGDTSLAGRTYTNVNGIPLSAPVSVQGGKDYMLGQEAQEAGNAWASNNDAAQAMQNKINKVAKLTGKQPKAVFFGMNPGDSSDFSSPGAEMVARMMPALAPSAEAVSAFNTAVRQTHPDFLGITHPGALDQMLGVNGFDSQGAGALRKRVMWATKQKSIENLGMPSYEDIHAAINDPAQLGNVVGDSGLATFDTVPGAGLNYQSLHNSYNRGIYGTPSGGFQAPIPADAMFPDIYYPSLLKLNRSGAPFSDAEAVGDVKMSHGYQIPDQQWLDHAQPAYEAALAAAKAAGSPLPGIPR